MKLACCILVKDDSELPQLSNAIKSIEKYVDGIFITSTGKDDKLIKTTCEANNYHYSHFKWTDDFAAARNFNFDQAVQHDNYDFILWIDSDDILVGANLIRDIAQKAINNHIDIVFLTYWYGCKFIGPPVPANMTEVTLEHMRERLIRPGTNIWKGRLHETPVPSSGYEPSYTKFPYDSKENPIAVMHTSDDKGLPQKMERNQKILEIQLEEERKKGEADPRTLLYLMKIYAEKGTEDLCKKVIVMGEEYLKKSGWEQERGICHEQMAIAHGKMGQEFEANTHLHAAIKEHPYQVLFYIRLAQSYYNLKRYRECEHWMKVGLQIDIDNKGSDQTNLKAIKVGYAALCLNLNWNHKKDVKKALEAAELLYKEDPTEINRDNLLFIQDANDLNDACMHTDMLSRYLVSIGAEPNVIKLLDSLPTAITVQPFAINLRKKFSSPIKWDYDEICYFANFGSAWFEKWDATNLSQGIGGSETAVIELAKQWIKLKYRVTVYGDPAKKGIDEYGINWLPYYYFNPRDSFNIFIQWRSWELAGKIKARKFFVDLHDICSNHNLNLEQIRNIDKVFFKSSTHRNLLTKLPDEKAVIIGNGVAL